MSISLETVLKMHFVKALAKRVCGKNFEIIERPAAFMLRNKQEPDRDIHRLIILPPKGYTANAPNQTNSHDEADYAKITIKGAVREGKEGFSKIKNCLLVASFHERGAVSDLSQPYLTFDLDGNDPELVAELHSAGEAPFPVVKNDGFGFYHNLINVSDDWLVLVLHKRLRPQKGVDLESHFKTLQDQHAKVLDSLYEAILKHGDEVFTKTEDVVKEVLKIPPSIALPALGEMLYIHDTGRHEACTVFGVILKMANVDHKAVNSFLNKALDAKTIPSYYARQLIEKISRRHGNDKDLDQDIPENDFGT